MLVHSDINKEGLCLKGTHLTPSVGLKKYIESYQDSDI